MQDQLYSEALQSLVEQLKSVKNLSQYGLYLEASRIGVEDLSNFVFFEEQNYTRNLVVKTPKFELMCIAWKQGHVTPIHDHNGSKGWMKTLQGSICETRYEMPQTFMGTYETLEEIKQISCPCGSISYIEDSLGVHRIANDHAGDTVTLHLYTPAIEQFTAFDLESGKSTNRHTSFYSEYGQKCVVNLTKV